MDELKWIKEARQYIGLKETPGDIHTREILQWWKDIKRGGIRDDETPWCAAFVGAMLEKSDIQSTRFESAKSYLKWGDELLDPVYGCIVVISRTGGGHVGFAVGRKDNNDLLILGGNQNNKVSIASFQTEHIIGFRWPRGIPCDFLPLPVGTAPPSENEK